MPADQTHEQYVASTLDQFDLFVATVIKAWPDDKKPLTSADFSAARYELLKMMNERHHANAPDLAVATTTSSSGADPDAGQYLPVTPAPWP